MSGAAFECFFDLFSYLVDSFLSFFLSVPAGPDSDCEKEAITVILYTYAASIVTWTVSITIFLTILEG